LFTDPSPEMKYLNAMQKNYT